MGGGETLYLGDRIDLRAIDADTTRDGNQAFAFGGTGKGHVWTAAAGSGRTWVYANTDADNAAELAVLLHDDSYETTRPGDYIAADFFL
jgi:serralysin